MKNTQEFFQLGVTKPSKSDVQNYLNGLGTRLMQLSDIKNKIIKHFKNIKKLQLDPAGRKVLSFEEVEIEEAVGKFMSGEVGIKGKRVKVEVEVTGVDNKQRIYHAKVLAPKEHFGLELQIPAKVMHRGKWIKTKTGKAFEWSNENV